MTKRIRSFTRRVGVDFRRVNAMTEAGLRVAELLNRSGVQTLLDVGANGGQYAKEVLSAGFAGRVISFEPLPEAWSEMNRQAQRSGGKWSAAPRVAVSDVDGEAVFHEAGNSVSSSLMEMESAHVSAAPNSAKKASISVRTRRLDGLADELSIAGPTFLKIDTQGAEAQVLAGAQGIMDSIVGVQVEMSLVPLYKGQVLAHDLHARLTEHGFECWDVIPGFRSPESLRLLQCDGVYFRSSAHA